MSEISSPKLNKKATDGADSNDMSKDFTITINDSNDPSYTRLLLPYRVVCRQRYRRAGVLQRKQFIKEIKDHELLQTKALDGVRIHREFCNVSLCPPRVEDLVKLTDLQRRKVEEILKWDF